MRGGSGFVVDPGVPGCTHWIHRGTRIHRKNRSQPAPPRPAADLTALTLPGTWHGARGSRPASFQQAPQPPAYQKIMEGPRSAETLRDHSPPDLPLSAKLPRNPGYSRVVASMVKRRRLFSQLAYGSGMHWIHRRTRIHHK